MPNIYRPSIRRHENQGARILFYRDPYLVPSLDKIVAEILVYSRKIQFPFMIKPNDRDVELKAEM